MQTPQPLQADISICALGRSPQVRMLIAWYGQSGTQMPQPLHCSVSTSEMIGSI